MIILQVVIHTAGK